MNLNVSSNTFFLSIKFELSGYSEFTDVRTIITAKFRTLNKNLDRSTYANRTRIVFY